MLFAGKLEVTGDKYEHAAGGAGGLTVDGGDAVLALLKREGGELRGDILGSLDLLPLEREHRCLLVQIRETCSVRVERAVVVLNESLGHRVGIHG